MTTIKVEVDRDAAGRLHGTIERDGPGTPVVRFSGVIEMVAHIEGSIDDPGGADGPGPDHVGSGRTGEESS